jgi:tryptophan-rich sensory protein
MKPILKLLLWVAVFLGVSYTLGQITQGGMQDWYQNLQKPSFNPPNIIFPIVWTILYITIAAAGWRLWESKASFSLKLIYGLYVLLNWTWTPIFFGAHEIAAGFIWIAAMNIINLVFIVKSWKVHKLSCLLMVPVFCWTLFAMVLNYQIWVLNP